jgi:ankyrin repeat protein
MNSLYSDWRIDESLFARAGMDWKTVSRILINRSVAEPWGNSFVKILKDPEDVEHDLKEDFGPDFSAIVAVLKQSKLIHAASHSDLDEVSRLIAAGVDVNACASNNQTALSFAARAGSKDVVSLLVRHGARIDTYSSANETPLMEVARSGRAEMVLCLIELGAGIDAKGKDALTPLMLAAKGGHLEVIRVLLQKGADTTAKDNSGWTASMHASLAEKEVASFLIREEMRAKNGSIQLSGEELQKANTLYASLGEHAQAGNHGVLENTILDLEKLLGRNDQIMLLHAQAFLMTGKLQAAACVVLDIAQENTDADFVNQLKTMIAVPLAEQAVTQLNKTLKPIVSVRGACSDYYHGQRLQQKEAAREPFVQLSLAHRLLPEREDITKVYKQVRSIANYG